MVSSVTPGLMFGNSVLTMKSNAWEVDAICLKGEELVGRCRHAAYSRAFFGLQKKCGLLLYHVGKRNRVTVVWFAYNVVVVQLKD